LRNAKCFVVAVAHARGYPAKTPASDWLNDHASRNRATAATAIPERCAPGIAGLREVLGIKRVNETNTMPGIHLPKNQRTDYFFRRSMIPATTVSKSFSSQALRSLV